MKSPYGNISSTSSTLTCWYAEGEEFQVPWINWSQGLQVELARRILRKLAHLSFLAFSSNMVTGKGALPEMSLIMMCLNSQVSSAVIFLRQSRCFPRRSRMFVFAEFADKAKFLHWVSWNFKQWTFQRLRFFGRWLQRKWAVNVTHHW